MSRTSVAAVADDPPRTAAILGVALGVSFTTCFLTGLWSHFLQHPPSWIDLPARPAGSFRVTQGIHVIAGFASIPLLLAKLAVVHHHLTAWPPVRSVAHAVERALLLPLVAGGGFLLFSGVANEARWYPWGFSFPYAHEDAAWIAMGGLVAHVGAKWGTTRLALHRERRLAADRRAFLGGVAAASGGLAVAVAGSSVPFLSPISFLAQRRPGVGPQGLPVNRTARAAGVLDLLEDPAWRLRVTGAVERPLELTLDELRSMPQREAELPIACVEGWSASARWRGVPVRDLLDLAGADHDAEVLVTSFQQRGSYGSSELNRHQARDRDTLVALELDGAELHPDHGYPARLIGPGRSGVLQTKWLAELEVR